MGFFPPERTKPLEGKTSQKRCPWPLRAVAEAVGYRNSTAGGQRNKTGLGSHCRRPGRSAASGLLVSPWLPALRQGAVGEASSGRNRCSPGCQDREQLFHRDINARETPVKSSPRTSGVTRRPACLSPGSEGASRLWVGKWGLTSLLFPSAIVDKTGTLSLTDLPVF